MSINDMVREAQAAVADAVDRAAAQHLKEMGVDTEKVRLREALEILERERKNRPIRLMYACEFQHIIPNEIILKWDGGAA